MTISKASQSAGWPVLTLIAAVLLGTYAGCGGPAPKSETAAKSKSKSTSKASTASEAPSAKHVRVDADGRKWLGDIPYDVFFDDPLAVVSNTQTVAATPNMTAAATTPAAPAAAPTATPAATPAASGGSDWKSIVTLDQLVEETKRVRNHMTQSLQSQGTYNGNYKELQVDGAVLAAIAGIVASHPEDVSWKPNAKYVRDYGFKLSEAAKALGRESYDQSQAASEAITSVFNGTVPPDAGDVAADRPFGEVASRAGVMKRIEKASEWMRANVNSEAVFNKEIEQIKQESTLIAAFAKVVTDPSYTSADEEDYQGYAKSLFEGAKMASGAAAEKSYPKFQESISKIQKACAECHANYGNG